jgi:hypothetical protein
MIDGDDLFSALRIGLDSALAFASSSGGFFGEAVIVAARA